MSAPKYWKKFSKFFNSGTSCQSRKGHIARGLINFFWWRGQHHPEHTAYNGEPQHDFVVASLNELDNLWEIQGRHVEQRHEKFYAQFFFPAATLEVMKSFGVAWAHSHFDRENMLPTWMANRPKVGVEAISAVFNRALFNYLVKLPFTDLRILAKQCDPVDDNGFDCSKLFTAFDEQCLELLPSEKKQ